MVGFSSKCLTVFNFFGFLLVVFLLCLGPLNSLIDLSASGNGKAKMVLTDELIAIDVNNIIMHLLKPCGMKPIFT